jgi:hypothetical protein
VHLPCGGCWYRMPPVACAHLQIINDAATIKAAYKEQPQHLDHLTSLIKDLYQVGRWPGLLAAPP